MKIININLQEGIILDEHNHPIAGFSKHLEAVIPLVGKAPSNFNLESLPDELQGFSVISGVTDSIGLRYWTQDGQKDCNELVAAFKMNFSKKGAKSTLKK